MGVIDIKNLTKEYGPSKGNFEISFSVEKGEVFGFLGPNGAGKTTTIRHLMGFLKPQKGSCYINGMDCQKESWKIQKTLGYIPGEIAFMDDMTGIGFIKFIAEHRGLKDLTRADHLMKIFELDPKGKIKKMSKGMKQKVGIVCAFMHDPSVIILDEPTSGLDPLMQNKFIELVLEEKEKGKTILMSSHILEEVERTCSRIGIIKDGRLVDIYTTEELKHSKTKKFIITLENEEVANVFSNEDINVESVVGNRVTVVVKEDIQKLISIMNKYPVVNIDTLNQSLEEVFMHYYGGDKNV